jgi:hypothetical protein
MLLLCTGTAAAAEPPPFLFGTNVVRVTPSGNGYTVTLYGGRTVRYRESESGFTAVEPSGKSVWYRRTAGGGWMTVSDGRSIAWRPLTADVFRGPTTVRYDRQGITAGGRRFRRGAGGWSAAPSPPSQAVPRTDP